MSSSWNIQPSACSVGTINPIRNIVDKIQRPVNHPLTHIDLALGDPSVFGNLPPATEAIKAVHASLENPRVHGYAPSMGVTAAREAIAAFSSTEVSKFSTQDIFITSGASQALLIAIQFLCNPGDALLIPCPGFSLYETICGHLNIEPKKYDLLAEKSWEVDLVQLESLITSNVKGILLNNPGNPTGSSYSKQHLIDIATIARKYKLPVIVDEVYANLVFSGESFTSFADICEEIPTFIVSGLAKRFLVPGWRVGWIALCDRENMLGSSRNHIISLTQVIVGACTIVQNAIPTILALQQEYHDNLIAVLERQAMCVYNACKDIDCLVPVKPQGAMYVMVGIDTTKLDGIADDAEFCQKLLNEQNIMVLPGSCFGIKNFFRIVFCAPEEKLIEVVDRLRTFCVAHAKK